MSLTESKSEIILFIIAIVSILHLTAFTQEASNKSIDELLYASQKNRLEQLLLRNSAEPDSLIIQLIDDSKLAATENDWLGAADILTFVIELLQPLKKDVLPNINTSNNATNFPPNALKHFEIESGFDYSQQEFEIVLLENDSVIVESLQNPFVSLQHHLPFTINKTTANIFQRLRADDQYFNYAFISNFEHNYTNLKLRLEIDETVYLSNVEELSDFSDTRMLFSVGNANWNIGSQLRKKLYFSEANGFGRDIFSFNFNLFYEHNLNLKNAISLSFYPSWYSEDDGYNYAQQYISLRYRNWQSFRKNIQFSIDVFGLQLENQFEDTVYENSYLALIPKLSVERAFSENTGILFKSEFESRQHQFSDEIMPDFGRSKLSIIPQLYLNTQTAIGVGYVFENKIHQTALADAEEIVAQEDFTSNGLAFRVEYFNLVGASMQLEYEINWRKHPNATSDFLDSYYTDRHIHTVNLFAWLPIYKNIELQSFANYNNDSSANETRSDSRSTLFSLGLNYRF